MSRKIPLKFLAAQIEDFSDHEILYLREVGPQNILIVGGNGTGKTHLAAALANRWRAEWVSVHLLMLRISKTMTRFAEESQVAIFEDFCEPRVLVIDDLLAATKSEWTFSWLLALLNQRGEDLKATIVTTERGLAEIEAVDSSIASRLSGYRIIRLTGPDRRVEVGGSHNPGLPPVVTKDQDQDPPLASGRRQWAGGVL